VLGPAFEGECWKLLVCPANSGPRALALVWLLSQLLTSLYQYYHKLDSTVCSTLVSYLSEESDLITNLSWVVPNK